MPLAPEPMCSTCPVITTATTEDGQAVVRVSGAGLTAEHQQAWQAWILFECLCVAHQLPLPCGPLPGC